MIVKPETWYRVFWILYGVGMLAGFFLVQVAAYLTAVWLMKHGWG